MLCSSEDFRAAMRLFPASVAVIATGRAPEREGMTATALCSLSVDPPQVLVCLNARSATSRAVSRNGVFSVNILSDDQTAVARRFAGMEGAAGEAKFEPGLWRAGTQGAPVMASAMQNFECRVVETHHAATHVIVVGEVQGLAIGPAKEALIYQNGTFGTFAPLSARETCA
jgi:flavin reductase (DIM6/NTAB) family NADH-FMN oxidoreductase RutF